MAVTLFNIFLWALFLVFFVDLVLLFLWAITIFKNKTPFIPIPLSILPDIYKALELKDDSVVYDLGSGDGRIVYYLGKQNPKIEVFGIENNLFALILSTISSFFIKEKYKKNVKIIRNSFFIEDLKKATHLVMYIYPNVMDDLLTKFDKELKQGTRLVSISFKFTNKKPITEIDLNRSKYKLARKLYVYEF